jgi:hypothetical protein
MTDRPYTFWLYDWSTSRVYTSNRWYPRYIRLEVNSAQIILYTNPTPLIIPLSQVESAAKYEHFQSLYAGRAQNAMLLFHDVVLVPTNTSATSALYLVPVDPLGYRPSIYEIDDLVTVVNSFVTGTETRVFQNPYQRALWRKGRSTEFDEARWNAQVSPNVYTPPLRKSQVMWAILLALVIVMPLIFGVVAIMDHLGWI